MKKIKFLNLYANRSVAGEVVKVTSCWKHKNLKFRFLLFILLIPVATGSFFIACNSEDPFSGVEVNDVDNEMQQILGTHLTVENNRYVLKLSEADAIALGVSQSFYAKFLAEIAESNAFIESTENDPNISVIFNGKDSQNINYKPIRLKNGNNEVDVNGWSFLKKMYPSKMPSYNSNTIDMPLGVTDIKFAFRTSASDYVYMYYQILQNQSTPYSIYVKEGESVDITFTIIYQMTWHVNLAKTTDDNCWVDVYYKRN
jgi:hypothetical protein